ncbi:MAG: AsmA-like C-terminal region-containing protein [Roseivirga sp.]|nr:AsmA-like C-terminal region-containing protein [Roseivirga sp.]
MSKSGKRSIWKKIFIGLASFFGLLILTVVGLIHFKKDEMITRALEEFNAGVPGRLSIEETRISAFENFPYVSIDLRHTQVYEDKVTGSEAIIDIEDAYIGFDLWSIVQGSYDVKKIKLSNGFVKLIQHEDGSFNMTNALTGESAEEAPSPASESTMHLNLQAIELNNIDLLKINEANNILAEVFIENIKSSFSMSDQHIKADFDSKMLFNLIIDGDTSFLHDKHLSLSTGIDYDLDKGFLDFSPSELLIEKASFMMEGAIDVANDLDLDLRFKGQKPNFDLFLAFVPDEYTPLLSRYENGGSVFFDASIKGPAAFGLSPHIEVDFGCEEAFIENTDVDKGVNDLFFKGHFTNGELNAPSTMSVTIEDFTARPETGTFKGAISIDNFESPDIQMEVNSEFNLDFLADFLNLQSLEDVSGKVSLDMNFHDIVDLNDPTKTIERLNESYYTELKVEDLNFTSPDFHLPFRDVNIHAAMDGHKAIIDQFSLKTGGSDVSITASISDLPAIIHHTDLPVDVNMDIQSALFDIKELTQATSDSVGFDEQIKNLSLGFKFNSTARAFTESPNLPIGEFFINELTAELTHYPHKLHDFNADIIIDSMDFKVIDFTGMIDKSDFHFNGKLEHYDLWFAADPVGHTGIDFDFTASHLQLHDLFSYGGENYVPEDYRHEEFQNLKVHGITDMEFDHKLKSVSLRLDKVEAEMTEHGIHFREFAGNLYMDSTHLEVRDFGGKLGNSEFTTDLTWYLNQENTDNVHSFTLKSPHLDFDQLFAYVPATPDEETGSVDHEAGFNVFELPFSNMNFDIDIEHMNYHRYLLDDFVLQGRMQTDHYIYVDTMALKTAGGAMRLNGYFNGSNPESIYFSPNMEVDNIDLDKLLFKFDNFGQDQLVSDNLHGKLSGTLTGAIHMHPDLIPVIDDSELQLNIEVLNGSLQNFSAFSAMSDYFTDKNLNLVRFDTLKNDLSLKNGDLIIPNMNLNTSLGYFEISGKQSLDLQMEYDVRIPLKVIARAGVQKLFARKNKDNSDQVDDIQYRDESKRTRFLNINIKGTPDDYDISLGKSKKRRGQ